MEPAGSFQRHNGEHVLVHRCLTSGQERFNRLAADDDFELVLTLPSLPPRTSHEARIERQEEALGLREDQYGAYGVA